MSQSMQNFSGVNMEGQALTNAENEDPLAQADTLKVVSCLVCHAVYIPSSRQQEIVRGPESLLESAFLTICHFCFRCQRPACPQCWNPIHHACASCSEEARLPFRSPVPSLEGLIFSAQPTSQETALSFTCLRDGNFYVPASSASAESLEPRVASAPSSSAYPVTSGDLPALRANSATSAASSSYPAWLQEAMSQSRETQNSGPLASVSGSWENTFAGGSAQTGSLALPSHTTSRPAWLPAAPALPAIPALPPIAIPPQREQSETEDDDEEEEEISLFERIENVLIIVISALLLAILLMIVLALSSADMNTFFFHILHIDIRTEILYLLQLR